MISNWKYILGAINLSFLLMELLVAPFFPFSVSEFHTRTIYFIFLGCFLLSLGSAVLIIFHKLKMKITPIRGLDDPGCVIYFFLIVGWGACFISIAGSWVVNNIYISILALIFWLGHIISWMLLWHSIKRIEEKK